MTCGILAKRSKLQIIEVPDGKGERNLPKEIMAESFPNLGRDLDI